MRKGPTYFGASVGGILGSLLPELWSAGQFSMWSLLFFALGGFLGIWLAYRYVS